MKALTLNQYIVHLQEIAIKFNAGDAIVVAGDETNLPGAYLQATPLPELRDNASYGDETSTSFSWKQGTVLILNT